MDAYTIPGNGDEPASGESIDKTAVVSIIGTWRMDYSGGYITYTFLNQSEGTLKSVSEDPVEPWVYETTFTYTIEYSQNNEATLTIAEREASDSSDVDIEKYYVTFTSNDTATLRDDEGSAYHYRRL